MGIQGSKSIAVVVVTLNSLERRYVSPFGPFPVEIYVRLYRLTWNDQIRRGNTCGEGACFKGQ